ncbi:CueP family metal-binding protein [Corynebacterium sp. 35RC1]|nr:CueP family metal-binding protein [Corynebacterium sp. 35RC1]
MALHRIPAQAAAAVLVGALALSACTPDNETSSSSASAASSAEAAAAVSEAPDVQWLAEHQLAGLDSREIITLLDAQALDDRPTDLRASIKPEVLELSDTSGETVTLTMPEDEFYVSIAPYLDKTHDCFYHSLTTCKGELGNRDVDVKVTDSAGNVVIEQATTTFDNGFVGLWLPRDLQGELSITLAGDTPEGAKTATVPLGTSADDPTCVTTVQLT